jgi:hypothetical protein
MRVVEWTFSSLKLLKTLQLTSLHDLSATFRAGRIGPQPVDLLLWSDGTDDRYNILRNTAATAAAANLGASCIAGGRPREKQHPGPPCFGTDRCGGQRRWALDGRRRNAATPCTCTWRSRAVAERCHPRLGVRARNRKTKSWSRGPNSPGIHPSWAKSGRRDNYSKDGGVRLDCTRTVHTWGRARRSCAAASTQRHSPRPPPRVEATPAAACGSHAPPPGARTAALSCRSWRRARARRRARRPRAAAAASRRLTQASRRVLSGPDPTTAGDTPAASIAPGDREQQPAGAPLPLLPLLAVPRCRRGGLDWQSARPPPWTGWPPAGLPRGRGGPICRATPAWFPVSPASSPFPW